MKLIKYGADFQYSVGSECPTVRAISPKRRYDSKSSDATDTDTPGSWSIPSRLGVAASRSVRAITFRNSEPISPQIFVAVSKAASVSSNAAKLVSALRKAAKRSCSPSTRWASR